MTLPKVLGRARYGRGHVQDAAGIPSQLAGLAQGVGERGVQRAGPAIEPDQLEHGLHVSFDESLVIFRDRFVQDPVGVVETIFDVEEDRLIGVDDPSGDFHGRRDLHRRLASQKSSLERPARQTFPEIDREGVYQDRMDPAQFREVGFAPLPSIASTEANRLGECPINQQRGQSLIGRGDLACEIPKPLGATPRMAGFLLEPPSQRSGAGGRWLRSAPVIVDVSPVNGTHLKLSDRVEGIKTVLSRLL